MKKGFLFIIYSLLFIVFVNAQTTPDTTRLWRTGGFALLNFSQTSLTNWAAGGNSSVAFSALGNIYANYKKGDSRWTNSLDLGYGVLEAANSSLKKTNDKIELNSQYGQLAGGKFFYSGLLDFMTQFSNGYNYPDASNPNQGIYVSRFFAPAYLVLSVGMDYRPVKYFDVYLSPATGRFTFVNDTALSTMYGLKKGETLRTQFGAYLNTKFQKDIIKNVNLMTKLSLFDAYTDPDKAYRTSVVVNWEVLIGMKVNRFLSASIYTNLIYDQSVRVPTHYEGTPHVPVSYGPRTQFEEIVGIGLSYKFNNNPKK